LVEVGAADPVNISVSFCFRSLAEQKRLFGMRQAHEWDGKEPKGSWDIISVEANPDYVSEFEKCGLSVLHYAACAEDIGKTSFRISPAPMSASALEVRVDGPNPIQDGAGGWWPSDEFRVIEVEALTLNTILGKHHPELTHIDVLLVDVEGWELEVLWGLDLDKYKPKVMVIENVLSLPMYKSYMSMKGYKLARTELQDQFYIRNVQ
jgi:FkbM family methyltransferase